MACPRVLIGEVRIQVPVIFGIEVGRGRIEDLDDHVGIADTGRRRRREQTRPEGAIDPINATLESFPENSVPLEDPAHGAATPSVRARDITTVCG